MPARLDLGASNAQAPAAGQASSSAAAAGQAQAQAQAHASSSASAFTADQQPPPPQQQHASPSRAHGHAHGASPSLATRVARRLHNVRCRFRHKKEVESEEDEAPAAPRHRPDRLDAISRATKFSREEIRCVYRAFKQECPSGAITEPTFKSIYQKFFPLGDSSQYAHYVFSALDKEQNGTITFGNFMLGLSMVVKGSVQERLRWAFTLYDVNHDGCITRQEMLDVISAIYNLMGTTHDSQQSPQLHVERIFKKLDLNHDGVITIDEFINYCSTDENIRKSLTVFDDVW